MKKNIKLVSSITMILLLAFSITVPNAHAESYSITGMSGNIYIVTSSDYVGYGYANTIPTVTAAQDGLTRVDYYYPIANCNPSGVDGQFGENTYYAVRNFQWFAGISVDGTVGPITWNELSNYTNNQ